MVEDTYSFEKFMKDELVKYIHQELLKGHSPLAIKEILLKGGHHHDMLEEVLQILQETNYDLNSALQVPVKGRILKQELYYDVLNAVIKYIELMLEHGHDIHQIEHMLYKHGHTKEIVTQAIDSVLFGKKPQGPKDYVQVAERFVLPLLLAIYLVFALLVSSSANEGIDRVIIGFVSLLLAIVIVGLAVPRTPHKYRPSLLAIPIVVSILFYVLGLSGIGLFNAMDVPRLAVLNAIFGVLGASVFIVTSVDSARRKTDSKSQEPKPLVGEEIESSD